MPKSKRLQPVKSPTNMFWQIFLWFWLSMLMVVVVAILVILLSLDKSAFNTKKKHAIYITPTWSHDTSIYAGLPQDHPFYAIHSPSITADSVVRLCPFYLLQEYPWLRPSRTFTNFSQHMPAISGVILVSLLFCFLLTRRIVRPIRMLQQTSHRLSNGDLTARVAPKVECRLDEMGELGRDFNLMAIKLQQLIDSKEQLLQDVSHELRSPLARLQMALALARKASCDRAQRYHDRIEREIERLDTLIGRLVAWSRLAIAPENQKEVLSLDTLLRTLIADTNYESQTRHVQVKLLESTDIHILGYVDMLESAIENIMRNAVRFSPDSGTIEVSQSLQRKHDQLWALIRIRDYGIGVPKECLDHLFEPFYRVNDTRGYENNGFGLGLAIAQRMVEHHHGWIQARNANPGLCVIIHLPINSDSLSQHHP